MITVPAQAPKPAGFPRRLGEFVVALALVAIAVLAFLTSLTGSEQGNVASTDSPMQLPRILLGIWMVLGLLCTVMAGFLAPKGRAGSYRVYRVALFAVILSAVSLGILFLGYLIPVTLGLGAMLLCLGERQPLRFALTLLILGPGLWALFHHGLGLRLPLLISGGVF